MVLGYLMVRHAGHVWGLDGSMEKLGLVRQSGGLRWLTARTWCSGELLEIVTRTPVNSIKPRCD
jgi:hypothetical protein